MTEHFEISEKFEGLVSELIGAAVKKSNLPEGVNIITAEEIQEAKKPFVVVTSSPTWEEARTAFESGAANYAVFKLNTNELVEELNKKGSAVVG